MRPSMLLLLIMIFLPMGTYAQLTVGSEQKESAQESSPVVDEEENEAPAKKNNKDQVVYVEEDTKSISLNFPVSPKTWGVGAGLQHL